MQRSIFSQAEKPLLLTHIASYMHRCCGDYRVARKEGVHYLNWLKGKRITALILTSCLLFSVSACSNPVTNEGKQTQKSMVNTSKEVSETIQDPMANLLERAPKEPTNLEEFRNYPVGPLAGSDFKKEEEQLLAIVKKALPPMKEGAEEADVEAWWRALRYLFSEEYPDSSQIVTQMKIRNFGENGVVDPRYAFKNQVNIMIILDASGSMANKVDGKPMMDIAKQSIQDFVSDIPAGANVGLRVFGIDGDQQKDSKSTLLYEIQPMDTAKFNQVLKPLSSKGWTPIARTLEDAGKDLAAFPGESNTNLVYLVSDGMETCGGDPAAAAKALAASGIQAVVNVIGFNVDMDAQRQLKAIAEAGGGLYANAGNQEQLNEALNQAKDILAQWEAWKKGAKQDVLIQKNSQINESRVFEDAWYQANSREYRNLFYVVSRLKKDHYIPGSMSSYFSKKQAARTEFNNKMRREVVADIRSKIKQSFDETQLKIDEEFAKNAGE